MMVVMTDTDRLRDLMGQMVARTANSDRGEPERVSYFMCHRGISCHKEEKSEVRNKVPDCVWWAQVMLMTIAEYWIGGCGRECTKALGFLGRQKWMQDD